MSESQVVVFNLNGQQYTLDIVEIKEIVRYSEPTFIPNAPSYMEGITNLRGEVIPILNLAKRLSLPHKQPDESTRIIIIDKNNKKIGLIVDEVSEVGSFKEDLMQPVDDISLEIGNIDMLSGVIKNDDHLWLMLNSDKVIN